MDSERDEMFRLTRIRMQNFKMAVSLAKQGGPNLLGQAGGTGAEMGSKNKLQKKKDKPNPCQPSSNPKKKKEAPVSTFIPDDTKPGEKKDCSKPM